jgi:hypothetical protein
MRECSVSLAHGRFSTHDYWIQKSMFGEWKAACEMKIAPQGNRGPASYNSIAVFSEVGSCSVNGVNELSPEVRLLE